MQNKIKILVFAHDSTMYGASKSLLTLLKEWKKTYNCITKIILPYPGEMELSFKEMGIKYLVIPFPRHDYKYQNQSYIDKCKIYIRYYKKKFKVLGKIKNEIKEFQPDIIYTNTSVVSIGYDASRRFNIPHVWHIREFGWEDYNLKYVPSKEVIKNKIKRSHTVFVSEILKDYWLGDKNQKLSNVIYNGIVDAGLVYTHRRQKEQTTIGILGAIMPGKGQREAILAINLIKDKYPNTVLEIYGHPYDMNYYNEIRKLVADLGVEQHVVYKGFNKDVEEIYKSIDIALNCSKMEGFGRTIVESMSRGIPVIANRSGAIPEIIQHGKNGLLYNQTIEDLANQLSGLISDTDLYKRIAKNALIEVKKKYTVTAYSKAVFTMLQKALNYNE